jgi:hypothetical protein
MLALFEIRKPFRFYSVWRWILSVFLLSCMNACDKPDPDGSEHALSANVTIANVELGDTNPTGNFRMIRCDIGWDHSWRSQTAPVNWDAAWIFAKFQQNGGQWRHATLSIIPAEHQTPAHATIETSADGKGVYLFRSQAGSGNFSASAVSLRWNCGLDLPDGSENINIRVFGLVMVKIPEGDFFAGDNGESSASFRKGRSDNRSWHIRGEEAIEVTDAARDGYFYTSSRDIIPWEWNANEDATGSTFTIPAEFPKGFQACYCMKHELTQQQYCDFLNALSPVQAANRYDAGNFDQFGYSIRNANGVFSTENPDRACGFLAAADGFAYADWAALRPMSELEFEKICRGSGMEPIGGEYAWGSLYLKNATGVNGDESDRGHLTSLAANSYYEEENYQPQFPLDCGIFYEPGKARERSGAGFYGVLDMSGNLDEPCVSIGTRYGRFFTRRNGDGLLAEDGFTNESDWPLRDGRGSGYRGGCLAQEWHVLRVSERLEASMEFDYTHRHIPWGFRGVRSIQAR